MRRETEEERGENEGVRERRSESRKQKKPLCFI